MNTETTGPENNASAETDAPELTTEGLDNLESVYVSAKRRDIHQWPSHSAFVALCYHVMPSLLSMARRTAEAESKLSAMKQQSETGGDYSPDGGHSC